MKFLFVRADVCRRLLSDSNSRWTPLPWAGAFPLLGQLRDLHPLADVHAEHTKKATAAWQSLVLVLLNRLIIISALQISSTPFDETYLPLE